MAFLSGLCRANKKQTNRPHVNVNVGYHWGPPSLSPRRTLAGPDKLALAAPWALRGKTVLMLAPRELIGSLQLVLCHWTLATFRRGPGEHERGANRNLGLVPKQICALLFNLISQNTKCAHQSTKALIRFYCFNLIQCYYMSFKTLSLNINSAASSSDPTSPLSLQYWFQLLLPQGWCKSSTSPPPFPFVLKWLCSLEINNFQQLSWA